jgi:zona occludens toxin (predicted ATPase)
MSKDLEGCNSKTLTYPAAFGRNDHICVFLHSKPLWHKEGAIVVHHTMTNNKNNYWVRSDHTNAQSTNTNSGARSAALSQKIKRFFHFFHFFKNSEFYLLLHSTRSFGIGDRQQKLLQQQAKPLAVASSPSLFPFPTPISAVEAKAKAKALPLGLRNQSVE